MAPRVRVTFASEERDDVATSFPQDATVGDLQDFAEAWLRRCSVQLTSASAVLRCRSDRPLRELSADDIRIDVVLVVGGSASGLAMSLIPAIKARRWALAAAVLSSDSPAAREAAMQRDEGGDTALSWAAYKGSRDTAALEVIQLLLRHAPSDAGAPSPGTGFLPLHDAAWGNASAAVAVLLAAALPEAVHARGVSGETPHRVGQSMHRDFAWPPPSGLLLVAEEIAPLVGEPLRPQFFARHVAVALQRFKEEEAPLGAAAAPEAAGCRRRLFRSEVVRARFAAPPPAPDLADDTAEYVREFAAKRQGRSNGLRRRDRCGVPMAAVVALPGGASHSLRFVRAVRPESRCCEAKWPSKAAMRRQRAMDRLTKRAARIVE